MQVYNAFKQYRNDRYWQDKGICKYKNTLLTSPEFKLIGMNMIDEITKYLTMCAIKPSQQSLAAKEEAQWQNLDMMQIQSPDVDAMLGQNPATVLMMEYDDSNYLESTSKDTLMQVAGVMADYNYFMQ